jgi:hypothetical protein
MIHIANGKRAIDLTIDDDEPDPRAVTLESNSRSKSRSVAGSVARNLTPSSRSSVYPDDEDEVEIYAARRVKRLKTRVEGRPFVPKKER